jgi:XTP/dITP diphosphohydrolase
MASSNPGKLRELAKILGDLDFIVLPQSDFAIPDADENGTTFVDNALIKARHAAALSGLAAIADDSGLVVDALGGRPGVHSARFAGANASDSENVDRLLHEMADIAEANRGAAFHCVACFVKPGETTALVGEGRWRGSIARQRRGTAGFGYDPVFIDPELGLTSAELGSEEKNRRSHRGKALAELVRQIKLSQ